MARVGQYGIFGLLLQACIASNAQPVSYDVPQVGGGVGFNINGGRQSETALTVTRSFLFTGAITFFNDFSVNTNSPLFDGTKWSRGYSIQGWSTSFDYGQTWEYRGQVSPPTGWASIGADPSVATDPNQPNIVYAASLAVSDAAWGTISADNQTTTTYPVTVSDSFCVAKSVDAGVTFPTENVRCRVVADILGGHGVDRTSLVVDGLGRVWVAVADVVGDNADTGVVRLYRESASTSSGDFVEVPPPVTGVRHQVLRRDLDGNIWLGTLGRPSGPQAGLTIVKYDIYGDAFAGVFTPDATCGRQVRLAQDVLIGGSKSIRNAHSYDFDFGYSEPNSIGIGGGKRVARFAWELSRSTGSQFVEVSELNADFSGACRVNPNIGSTMFDAGSQFMPAISYAFRTNSATPGWWVTYLTTAGVLDNTLPEVHPEAVQPTTASHVQPQLTLITQLAPADWSACPSSDYWGDYFGLAQLRDPNGHWWSVAAFTDSRPGPSVCVSGNPQHVAASRW